MKNFFKKYKDPRWQKKRLLIMERDKFSCKNCGRTDSELFVHHRYYKRDSMPWEYPDNALVTYCGSCHDEWHRLKGMLDKEKGYLIVELEWLIKCAKIGPHRAIKKRFLTDTENTILMLSALTEEAMKQDSKYHSQVVDCCLVLKEFVHTLKVNRDDKN